VQITLQDWTWTNSETPHQTHEHDEGMEATTWSKPSLGYLKCNVESRTVHSPSNKIGQCIVIVARFCHFVPFLYELDDNLISCY